VLRLVWDLSSGRRTRPDALRPGINPAPRRKRLARLVLDSVLAGVTGKYFPSHTRWREAASSEASYDAERARLLWDESVRLTKLTGAESPLAVAESSRSSANPS
jgi:hypothetical protein